MTRPRTSIAMSPARGPSPRGPGAGMAATAEMPSAGPGAAIIAASGIAIGTGRGTTVGAITVIGRETGGIRSAAMSITTGAIEIGIVGTVGTIRAAVAGIGIVTETVRRSMTGHRTGPGGIRPRRRSIVMYPINDGTMMNSTVGQI